MFSRGMTGNDRDSDHVGLSLWGVRRQTFSYSNKMIVVMTFLVQVDRYGCVKVTDVEHVIK